VQDNLLDRERKRSYTLTEIRRLHVYTNTFCLVEHSEVPVGQTPNASSKTAYFTIRAIQQRIDVKSCFTGYRIGEIVSAGGSE
jgi:hypothetical protein